MKHIRLNVPKFVYVLVLFLVVVGLSGGAVYAQHKQIHSLQSQLHTSQKQVSDTKKQLSDTNKQLGQAKQDAFDANNDALRAELKKPQTVYVPSPAPRIACTSIGDSTFCN